MYITIVVSILDEDSGDSEGAAATDASTTGDSFQSSMRIQAIPNVNPPNRKGGDINVVSILDEDSGDSEDQVLPPWKPGSSSRFNPR